MSNKTKKMNKVEKAAEVVEEEEIENAEVVEATVEETETKTNEAAEVEAESSEDSEVEAKEKTVKVLRPVAYIKGLNWKKALADAGKIAVGLGIGYVVGKKAMGGHEEPSETTQEVIDAEFTVEENDVETQEEN